MKTLKERLFEKIVKSDGCWEWIGAKHRFGYGMIRLGGTQPKITASRASWLVHNGEIPNGMHVCHKCDNPQCTNPDHLFLGTAGDNANDKEQKGRGLRRFNNEISNAIATLHCVGVSLHALARAFNADRKSIKTALRHGQILPNPPRPYREPKPPSPPPILRGEKNHKAKLTEKDVFEIRKLRVEGLSTQEIASHFAVGKSMVSHICTRRCWTHI